MNKIKYKIMNRLYGIVALLAITITILFTACVKDLNVTPINPQLKTNNLVYKTSHDYMQGLAKLYGSYSLTGQKGPAGDATGDLSSIPGSDEGNSGFYRVMWMIQEASTDEAIVGWSDPGLPQLRTVTFTPQDAFSNYGYYRIMFTVGICNQFLRDASDAELSKKGLSQTDKDQVIQFRNEARFLRALAYYYGLDIYRNMPFVTEKNVVGGNIPSQYTGEQLYNYLVSELKDLVDNNLLPAPSADMYGRATAAAAAALLAKLYLNAAVYLNPTGTIGKNANTGFDTKKMDSVILYCNKIIQIPYLAINTTSSPKGFNAYEQLFMGDNGQNLNAQKELIFAIQFDHANSTSYNGTNFIINASVGAGFDSAFIKDNMGLSSGGWGGARVRPAFLKEAFGITTATNGPAQILSIGDDRGMFYMKKGGTFSIADPTLFNQGLSSVKFKNHYSTDATGTANEFMSSNFYDTDFPVIRMGEIYLMRAEATLRGGTGSPNTVDADVNVVRNRAHAGNLSHTATLQDILDERGRELYHEGWRRSDLIRFGQFTKNYVWEFKGGDNQPNGIMDLMDYLQIFPIPAKDLAANPNLKQNPGY